MSPERSTLALARAVVREVRAREIPMLAAGIAYYAFVSLVPLLVLAVVAASVVGGDALEAVVVDLAQRYLLPVAREPVVAALRGTRAAASTTFIGLAVLAWSSLRLFRGVDVAFSRVYGSAPGGFADRIADGVVVAVGVGVGVLFTGGVGVALGRYGALGGLVVPLSLLVLVVAFFPVFYVFPDTDVTAREVLPGTLFAATAWTLLAGGFGLYASLVGGVGEGAVYGVLGAVVLLVTWFYFAGLAVLSGAVLNAVLAGRIDGDRQVQLPPDRQVSR